STVGDDLRRPERDTDDAEQGHESSGYHREHRGHEIRHDSRLHLTEIRAAQEEHRADRDEAATHMIGYHRKQDGAAEDRADRVRALRDRDEDECRDAQTIAHEAERRDGEAPCGDREQHRYSLTPHAPGPSRSKRGDE